MPSYQGRKCWFTENKVQHIDYKNVTLLRRFLDKDLKIVPRYYTGTALKYQKMLSRAVKNARYMGLIPFTR